MKVSTGSSAAADLKKRIDDRTLVVGVMGLGYVGLPLALTFAEKRVAVLGFDVDSDEGRRAPLRAQTTSSISRGAG